MSTLINHLTEGEKLFGALLLFVGWFVIEILRRRVGESAEIRGSDTRDDGYR